MSTATSNRGTTLAGKLWATAPEGNRKGRGTQLKAVADKKARPTAATALPKGRGDLAGAANGRERKDGMDNARRGACSPRRAGTTPKGGKTGQRPDGKRVAQAHAQRKEHMSRQNQTDDDRAGGNPLRDRKPREGKMERVAQGGMAETKRRTRQARPVAL